METRIIKVAATRQSCELGINFFVDSEGPTTSIVCSVLSHLIGADNLLLETAERARLRDYLARPTVFSRVCSPALAWLPRALRAAHARYVFYLDDNLWEYQSDSPLGKYYAREDVLHSLDCFVRHAATVVVNSGFLANYVRQRFPGVSVVHVPAPFDFSKLPSEHQTSMPSSGAPLRVGYAGSARGDAFLPVAAAIERVLGERPGQLEFEFIGYVPDRLEGMPGVTRFPDITDYQQFLTFKQSRGWQAALAPLARDSFSSSKTNNKYREYGAMGIPGLYSATGPYLESVRHGVNGLLVEDGEENWSNALRWLVDNKSSLEAIGANATEDVRQKHGVEAVAAAWSAALGEAGPRPAVSRKGLQFVWTLLRASGRMRARLANYACLKRQEGTRALLVHLGLKLRDSVSTRGMIKG